MAAKVRVKGTVNRNPRGRSPLVLLREDFARAPRPMRVDRERGIIFGVKVVGLDSPNTHDVKGATAGTVYTPEALRNAARLYEGVVVNVNHPDRGKPKADRSSYDRFGKLVDVRVEPDGLYADLHLLTSHPMAQRVMEAAEKMPDLFGLSHHAYGRGEVRDGKYVITEIPEVHSVDLVADPGSNKSLFESQERIVAKRTLREQTYEDDGMGDGGADEPELHDHLGAAILTIMQSVKDGEMSPEEGKKKVLSAYKLATADESDEEEKDKDVEEDDERAEDTDKEPGKGEKQPEEGGLQKPRKAQESRREKAPQGAARLTETRARALCELAGVEPADELLESLTELGEEKALRHLAYVKKLAGKGGQRPRTQVRESFVPLRSVDQKGDRIPDVREIKDGKGFAALLRGGPN